MEIEQTPPAVQAWKSIQLVNLGLAIAACLVALIFFPTLPILLGTAAGGLINVLNFLAIDALLRRVMQASSFRPRVVALFILKFLALLCSVAAILRWLPVSPLAFVVSFSLFIPAMVAGTLTVPRSP